MAQNIKLSGSSSQRRVSGVEGKSESMRYMKCVAAALVVTAACSSGVAVDDRIGTIEDAIVPTLVVEGRPIVTSPLADLMDELNVPGLSVAVISDGEIAWAKGYGFADTERGIRVTTDTVFQAASISKPVAPDD